MYSVAHPRSSRAGVDCWKIFVEMDFLCLSFVTRLVFDDQCFVDFNVFFVCYLQMDKLRPEFRAGLDKLTKYILDRAGPKQLGSITLTGPMFASLTQSFLDAINSGAVPTIANSWQVDLYPQTPI